MDLREEIMKVARLKEVFSTNDVLAHVKDVFTRGYVLRFINNLIDERVLVKSGSTRGAEYALYENRDLLSNNFAKKYKISGLKEHEVLDELIVKLSFIRGLAEHLRSIFSYAFSEMLNNAIDHSQSRFVFVSVEKKKDSFEFVVEDAGIGVFKNIMEKRGLNSQLEAIQDLMKGKVTTMPHAHSGEGIFFTSKVADVFVLQSYEYELKIDNNIDDIFIGKLDKNVKGTKVVFNIGLDHGGHLDDVFRQYYTDPDDLAFDKTEVRIKLFTKGSIYISRSQAKRVIAGLEKFRTVILDFDKVPSVGQAFADEIFRVFQSRYPEIQLIPENMNEAVKFMVERVEKP